MLSLLYRGIQTGNFNAKETKHVSFGLKIMPIHLLHFKDQTVTGGSETVLCYLRLE